jgi:hypothetical protein
MPKNVTGVKTDKAGTLRASAHPADPTAKRVGLDPEAVARLAYSYWEARGRTGGSPEEDWFRAEKDLRTVMQDESAEASRMASSAASA